MLTFRVRAKRLLSWQFVLAAFLSIAALAFNGWLAYRRAELAILVLLIPIAGLFWIGCGIFLATRPRRALADTQYPWVRLPIWATRSLGVLIVVSGLFLFGNFTATRWLIGSHFYKAEAMAQPSANGQLKHIEWTGWGWAGQNTTVYLVFDPTDSLSAAAKGRQSGKFNGIPCEVYRVHRLESRWYTAQFYTGEVWGQRNALNCTGFQE